jgi:cation transport ATPase
MSRLRWALVALLATSTILFANGVIAERSDSDTHTDTESAAHAEETSEESGEAEGAHDEAEESAEGTSEDVEGSESGSESEEDERLLGIDLESTPLVVLAVLAGLGLAGLAATRFGQLRWFLLAVVVIALVWAILDIREVAHQLDESNTGIALVAIAVAVLHLATAAVSARLARESPSAP